MDEGVGVRGPLVARSVVRRPVLAVVAVVVAITAAAVLVVSGPGHALAVVRAKDVPDQRVARSAVAVAGALDGMAVVLVAVLALVTVAVLFAALTRTRRAEDALLVGRGATRRQRATWSAAEGAVAGLVGAVVGVVIAVVVAITTGTSVSLIGGAVVVVGGVVLVAATAAVTGSRPTAARTGTARWRLWVAAGVVVVAAVFATWRLFTVGLPVRFVGGVVETDPVAAVAPVVAVFGGAAVVVAVAGAVASVVAASVGRTRSLAVSSVARRLARTWASGAPAVLVIGAVTASGILVAGLAATTAEVADAAARSVVGPDVRVTTTGDQVIGQGTAVLRVPRDVRAASSVAPVLRDTVRVGNADVPLVATVPSAAAAVVPGAAGRAVAEHTRAPERAGVALPRGAATVAVDVASDVPTLARVPRPDAAGALQFEAWLVDPDGIAAEVPLRPSGTGPDAGTAAGAGTPDGAVAVGTSAQLTADLPAGHDWRLVAVEPTLTFQVRPPDADPTFLGAERLHVRVQVRPRVSGATSEIRSADVVDLTDATRIAVGAAPVTGPLPIVVSTAFASRVGVHDGDRVDLEVASVGRTVHARVAAVVPDIPGTADTVAVATGLPRLMDVVVADGAAVDGEGDVPRVGEVWFASTAPAATAKDLPRAHVRTAADVDPGPVLGVALGGLWLAVGLGCLFAALVLAVAAVVDARRADDRMLRALGVGAPDRARWRAVELALPVAAAIVGGVGAGVVAVATTVAPFGLAAVPLAQGLVTSSPVLSVVGLSAAAATAVLAAAVVVVAAARVRRADAEATR